MGQIIRGALDRFNGCLGEEYLETRNAERKQQLLHYLTFGCLDAMGRNPAMCAGKTIEGMEAERLKDTNGEPRVLKSC